MTQFPFPDSRRTRWAFALFLLALLLLSRNTMFTTALLGVYRAQLLSAGLMALAAVIFLTYNRSRWREIFTDRRLLVFGAFALAVAVPMLVKRDWQMMYLSILMGVALAIFLSYFVSCQEVARSFVALMTALGLYSIIALWVLRPLMVDTGLWIPPMFTNSRQVWFYHFGVSFVSEDYVSARNFGIFREPGVHQFFLMLALYLNNDIVRWGRTRTLWLVNLALAAVVLTTMSTVGVAALGVLAVLVFIDKGLFRNRRAWIVVGVLALLLAALLGFIVLQQGELYWELYGMVISKFLPGEDSAVERLEAVAADLTIFLRHPLVGGDLAQVLYAAVNNTTSTLILCAGLGIAAGALHIASWVALVWRRQRRWWLNLGYLGVLFLCFNTQNLTTDVFFWLFPVMALTQGPLPGLARRKGGD